MHGDLSANKEKSQQDQRGLEQKACKQKSSCWRSGSQVRSLGRPRPGLGTGCRTGIRAGGIGVQLWLGRQTPVHDLWHQARQQARLCPTGTGQTAQPVHCPHLALPRTSVVNTLQAKCPRGAPPDLCVCYAFFLPDNSVL